MSFVQLPLQKKKKKIATLRFGTIEKPDCFQSFRCHRELGPWETRLQTLDPMEVKPEI